MIKNNQKLSKEASELGIRLIVLFGSQALKKATNSSDFDVAVLTDENKDISDFKNYNIVLGFLSETLKLPREKIDLTKINQANPLLQHEIFSNGILIFGDSVLFDEYRALAFREFIDAKKLFETEFRMIKNRIHLLNQSDQKYA